MREPLYPSQTLRAALEESAAKRRLQALSLMTSLTRDFDSTPAKRTVGGEITNTPGSSVPRAKRTKVSSGPSGGDLSTALTLGQDDLVAMGASDELVAHIQTLQASYSALYLQLETEKQKKQPIVVTEEETWSDEKVATKVQQIKQMANGDIAKQLKWCVPFRLSAAVPCEASIGDERLFSSFSS